jgi:glucoamylase
VPSRELENGRASGGAMPLVWAHAEYAKLVRSLHDGRVFDMPQQPYERYIRGAAVSTSVVWSARCRPRTMPAGARLQLHLPGESRVTWWGDDGKERQVIDARCSQLGVWIAELETPPLPAGTTLRFTIDSSDHADTDHGAPHAIAIVALEPVGR